MKGILIVDLPSCCTDCENFRTILDKPLIINFSNGSSETVVGACACKLDYMHRLKPIDNDTIMELIPKPNDGSGRMDTESCIYSGRPHWCPIREGGILSVTEENVARRCSSQESSAPNQRTQ